MDLGVQSFIFTDELCLKNIDGDTALMVAAMAGNTSAARILVRCNLNLPYILNNDGLLPVHKAASSGKRDTLKYLLQVTKGDVEPNPFQDQSGAQLLIDVIVSGFFDVAIDLVKQYPNLATLDNHKGDIPLKAIARKASAFPSGNRSNFLERVIYSCVPVDLDSNGGVVENQANNYEMRAKFRHLSNLTLRNLVPGLQAVQDKKLIHHQALRLVKYLCEQIKWSKDYYLESFHFGTALLLAAGLGIHEVVEEIVDTFPYSIWYHNEDKHYIFQIAVVNRCEKVFNLIYQMSEHRNYITTPTDTSGNNILHLAGRLAPLHKLNLVSGAALQMQRELQWFQEVEKFVNPAYKEMLNSTGETPAMVFTKEHRNLMIEGEKWMKDTANSCTIAAALIATVVFAAAITVPGGNNGNNGLPIFSQKKAFKTFVVSDAISLFTSITSLLMFLSILTSRYAEGDFLRVLPKRLIIGLVTLFLSITSMMVAFSATLYLVLDQERAWILIPVAVLACLPVTSFVFLQFPLLVDAISSTYGRGIFGKQSERPFY
uniref:Putative alpha-latrocrustotoxin-Lt1a-like isoform X1 n=1 Tax=Davidia involucrata TaxID=16924 RepID=A0A5B6ZHY9_DAVIN